MLVGTVWFILVESCIYSKTKKGQKANSVLHWLVVDQDGMEGTDTNFGYQAFFFRFLNCTNIKTISSLKSSFIVQFSSVAGNYFNLEEIIKTLWRKTNNCLTFPSTLTTGWPVELTNSTFFRRSCQTESQNLKTGIGDSQRGKCLPNLNDQSRSAFTVRLESTWFSSLSQIVSSNFLRTADLTLGEICSYSSSSPRASWRARPTLVPRYRA